MSPPRKIPSKADLVRLQKLYKTDEKIGEVLGGVAPYLVAYWRRKKNVPKYSLPKFSENEVRVLWERFGDDDRCGLELGISKPAFYNWRRRYGIREKPAFLKLEQLELNFPGLKTGSGALSLYGEQSISQKILALAAGLEKAETDQQLEIEPHLAVTGESCAEVIGRFHSAGGELVWNPGRLAIALQHPEGANSTEQAKNNKSCRDFARRQSIRSFFDVIYGYSHQLVLEQGLLRPGQFAVGCEAQFASLGCLASFTQGISTEEMAQLWATGRITVTVPGSIRVDIIGRRVKSISARDIGMHTVSQLRDEDTDGKVVEFYGSLLSHLTMGERLALASMAEPMGTAGAICLFDSATRRYLTGRTTAAYAPLLADKDARYDGLYQISIDPLHPQLGGPNSLDRIRPVTELEGATVHQIVIGTCASGRFEDLRLAAEILKGSRVNRECRLIVAPASRSVYLDALKKGLIRVFIEAGAIVVNPGSRLDFKHVMNMLAPGERCLATINPPIENRSPGSEAESREIYFCSAATGAASALNGTITDPTRYLS